MIVSKTMQNGLAQIRVSLSVSPGSKIFVRVEQFQSYLFKDMSFPVLNTKYRTFLNKMASF